MTNDWNNVKPVGCKHWLVLPAVYSDALSYGDQIAHFCAALNKLIQNNNTLPEYIQQMIQDYINGDVIGEVVQNIVSQFILNVKYPPENLTPAVGDGSADDTEAIQGCINYAKNHNGMAVYIPSGAYSVQSLTLPGDVSLFGFDRYTTKLVLRGGATTPMISSTGTGFSIVGLTLDGNAGIQVENINVLSLISQDVLLRDLILQNGYKLLVYNGTGGHLQVNDIVFGSAVYDCVEISGGSMVQFDNCQFTALSQVGGQRVIDISSDGGVYDFVNNAICPVCCVVSGNDNHIQFSSNGAQNNFSDTGLRNNIIVNGQEVKEYLSNDFDSTIEGSYGQNVNGAYSENISGAFTSVRNSTENKTITGTSTNEYKADKILNVTGNFNTNVEKNVINNYNQNVTENVTNTKTITSNDLILNLTNPLGYNEPENLNELFDYVEFKNGDNIYKILVDKNAIDIANKKYVVSNSNMLYLNKEGILSLNYKNFDFLSTPNTQLATQGCTLDDSFFYIGLRGANENNQFIVKLNRTTGTYTYSQFTNMSHINSMTSYGNYLIVCGWGENQPDSPIFLVNKNDLTIAHTYENPAQKIISICYDGVTNTIYGRDGNFNLYSINIDTESPYNLTFTFVNNMNIPTTYTGQGMGAYNNNIYVPLSNPETIITYSIKENKITNAQLVYEYVSLWTWRTGELEDMEIIDGKAYVFSNYIYAGQADKCVISTIVSSYNINGPTYIDIAGTQYDSNHLNLYVDKNNTNILRDGSVNNPFNDLFEAIQSANGALTRGLQSYITIEPGEYVGGEVRGPAINYINGNDCDVDILSFYGCNIGVQNINYNNTIKAVYSHISFNGFTSSVSDKDSMSITFCVGALYGMGGITTNNPIYINQGLINLYDDIPVRLIASGVNPTAKGTRIATNVNVTQTSTPIELNESIVSGGFTRFTRYEFIINGVIYSLSSSGSFNVGENTITVNISSANISVQATQNITINEVRLF